jgi:hypothetical protein
LKKKEKKECKERRRGRLFRVRERKRKIGKLLK